MNAFVHLAASALRLSTRQVFSNGRIVAASRWRVARLPQAACVLIRNGVLAVARLLEPIGTDKGCFHRSVDETGAGNLPVATGGSCFGGVQCIASATRLRRVVSGWSTLPHGMGLLLQEATRDGGELDAALGSLLALEPTDSAVVARWIAA